MPNVRCRYGTFTVHEGGDLISRCLAQYGEWAQLEIECISKFIKTGDTVIDAGACLGTHSLAFSHFVGQSGKVIAFEPNPESFELLKANAHSNKNIQLFKLALGCSNETLGFYSGDKSNHGTAGIGLPHSTPDIEVSQRRLDDVLSEKVNFIKVDVEGREYDFLRGAKQIIEKEKPVIFLEVNSVENSYQLMEWARSAGYCAYGVMTATFNEHNFKAEHQNIFGNSAECGILLISGTRTHEFIDVIRELKLPLINTLDDLALLLMHKPQYPFEVLHNSDVAHQLGDYSSQVLSQLTKQIDELKQTVASMKASHSWQITAPLRKLMHMISSRDT